MLTADPSTLTFEGHARAVVRQVQGVLAELLTTLDANPHDPQSISRRTGLNKNLAWKISKIIQTDDPAVALEQMPGDSGIKIFLRCVEQAGAPAPVLEAAQAAIREYDRLIRVHSGDRATLEIMGSELGSAGRQQRDEFHRKMLFQGASYVWGAQAGVILKVGLVGPGAEPGLLDFVSLSALVDFRRFRAGVTWVMAVRRSTNDDGSAMPTSLWEPVDARYAGADCPPLMADFCSQPLPELRRFTDASGANYELVEGPVGNTGTKTVVVGAIQRRVPYYRTPVNEWGEHAAMCDTPAKLLILDVYFHETLTFAIPPEPILYGNLGPAIRCAAHGRDRNRLPLHETLQDLGQGALPVATPEVRRYNDMVRTLFERVGWRPAQFRGFRMKIAYPAIPTALVLRYPLPAAPQDA